MRNRYLPFLVLLGAAVGVAIGFSSPNTAELIAPVGSIYIRLMEVVVLPYIISSLIIGLGRLAPANSLQLLNNSWRVYLSLWIAVFATLILIAATVPLVQQSVVVDFSLAAQASTGGAQSLIDLLVPDNLFTALNQNYIPAVVLMGITYGVAVQYSEKHDAFLDVLSVIRSASVRIWGWVVLIAPVGVCALFAETISSVGSDGIAAMSLYIVIVVLSALLIALWVLPMTLTAFLPMRYWEIMSSLKDAFLVSIFTSLSVAALPAIQTAAEEFASKYAGDGHKTENKEIIQTTLSISYPLAQIGNFFVLPFIMYASFYYFVPISFANLIELPFVTLLSGVGSPTSSIGAVSFMADWLNLPEATTNLYVETMSITRYAQVLASVAAFAFVTFLVTFVSRGQITFKAKRFAATVIVSVICLAGIFSVGHWSGTKIHLHSITNYLALNMPSQLQAYSDANLSSNFKQLLPSDTPSVDGEKVTAATPETANANLSTSTTPADDGSSSHGGDANIDTLHKIQARGVIRVGVNPHVIPFSYENNDGRLVGFDVEMLYRFSESMNVEISFVPYQWQTLIDDLSNNDFDIALGGLYITDSRLQKVTASDRYYVSPLALIVKTRAIDKFSSRDTINSEDKTIGVFDDPVLVPLARRYFPSAKITVLPNYDDPDALKDVDAAIWTLEQARAWALSHPGYSAVVPKDVSGRFLFGFLMPENSQGLADYLNYWMRLQQTNGVLDDMTKRWLDADSDQAN